MYCHCLFELFFHLSMPNHLANLHLLLSFKVCYKHTRIRNGPQHNHSLAQARAGLLSILRFLSPWTADRRIWKSPTHYRYSPKTKWHAVKCNVCCSPLVSWCSSWTVLGSYNVTGNVRSLGNRRIRTPQPMSLSTMSDHGHMLFLFLCEHRKNIQRVETLSQTLALGSGHSSFPTFTRLLFFCEQLFSTYMLYICIEAAGGVHPGAYELEVRLLPSAGARLLSSLELEHRAVASWQPSIACSCGYCRTRQ